MTTWIILGVLIVIIAGFLIWTSISDKKKAKGMKENQLKLEKHSNEARGNVAIWIVETLEFNDKMLEEFVPSVGKYKMSDIKSCGVKAIEALMSTKAYKLAMQGENNNDILSATRVMLKTGANSWNKKLSKEIELFKKESQVVGGEYEEFRKDAKRMLGEIYDKR